MLAVMPSCVVWTVPAVACVVRRNDTPPPGATCASPRTTQVAGSCTLVIGCCGTHGFGTLPLPAAAICAA